ncbi:glycerol-3-phosphate 1-O-acyltransferase PlsY [Clostridiaceae bacterium OttesenSCG-928-D20]|nr:glycerol-3-phosphate 1-O-acyltransferase PlsY [Clostridiaceae bacterium OttesenSCG-928-D20]
MLKAFLLILIGAASYVLGSLNGAIIASNLFFKKDIRGFGSGNPGLTNFHRTFGVGGAALVILIDMLKTVIACLLGKLLLGVIELGTVGLLFGGFCAMVGHAFPFMYEFKGGKGVLAGGTIVIMLDWRVALICWGVFLLTILFSRYVSLGSVLCALCLPLSMWMFKYEGIEVTLGLFCALLLIVRHGENIVRLINGRERKLEFNPPPKH